MTFPTAPADVTSCVRRALSEDIGTGDLTASLIPESNTSLARVITREAAVLCGRPWFDETFKQLDAEIHTTWHVNEGDELTRGDCLCEISGPSRGILTGERTALNFLQLLSYTATISREFNRLLDGTGTQLLDTRKTLPGLRTAQKYAVACGGGKNHRMGLYDAILIKENHIREAGSIANAVTRAKLLHGSVEVEVENLKELDEAIEAGANTVMLDNFDLAAMQQAVELNNARVKLEVSGNVDKHNLREIADTGVDYISVGALTKNIQAIDYSMQFSEQTET